MEGRNGMDEARASRMTLGLEEGMGKWIDFLGKPFNHIDHNVIHLLSVQCNPFPPSRL